MQSRLVDRRKTLLSAKISTGDSIDDCMVHDLSINGAEIQSVATLLVDQKVTLEIPRIGPIPARVAWDREKLMGLQFLEQLEEGTLSILMAPKGADEDCANASLDSAQDVGERASLEASLLEVARRLSCADLAVAIKQIGALADRGD